MARRHGDEIPVVAVIEQPDTTGDRWQAAIALLLEAGQVAEEETA